MASTTAQTTLSGKSAAQEGTTIDFAGAKSRATAVLIPSGAVTGGVVIVEGSQDSTNWVTLHAFDAGRPGNQFYNLNEGAFRYFRGSVATAVAGGGTVSMTLMEGDR